MTQPTSYRGLPVSEGMAAGQLYPAGQDGLAGPAGREPGACPTAPDEVAAAFAAVAGERSALADQLRTAGRSREADIVAIGALIAADPALVDPAVAAARDGAGPAAAVRRSAEAQAAAIAALPSPELAARADDVRQVAGAVLARLAGEVTPPPPSGQFILVRREVDPADLINFAESGLAGAVSVSGGASSHAAIIARGLGIPMLAGADPAVLTVPAGRPAIVDAVTGRLIVDPPAPDLAAAQGAPAPAARSPVPGTVPRTRDGHEITLLCNVASATEARLGLASGASGVGLLRTEISFLNAMSWPTEADHRAALDPVLELLAQRPAVVRLLDFTGDKVPPFLAGQEAGLAGLLGNPRALGDQLRAVLRSGRDTQLSVMIPMVTTLDEVALVRAALADAADLAGTGVPRLGMMVEMAATAAASEPFAEAVDFFSIGTNDLTSQVLGLDRADQRMRPALAADPAVLALIARVVRTAEAAGVGVSVCGDAAADPAVLPLLIGLGVRTLSVGAALLPRVAAWLADADAAACTALARQALRAASLGKVRPGQPRASQAPAHVQAP